MTQANEITVRGRYCRVDCHGYENDPERDCRITVITEHDIEVPAGMMDIVVPAGDYWDQNVAVRCHRNPDGELELLDIDFDDEEDEDDEQPETDDEPDDGQMTFPNMADADSMATALFDHIANSGGGGGPVTLPVTYWKTALRLKQEDYSRWEITMKDESVVEVNPIPSQSPTEPWLWAVLYGPDNDRTLLTQGGATLALYQACHQME